MHEGTVPQSVAEYHQSVPSQDTRLLPLPLERPLYQDYRALAGIPSCDVSSGHEGNLKVESEAPGTSVRTPIRDRRVLEALSSLRRGFQ